jgi:2-hydroxy-6-oxonona-2,4-dienedioate hydrolase
VSFVLVHGLGVSHRYFERLHALLPDSIAPDLAGSSVGELTTSLARVAPGRATFVGSSLGCQIAVELAIREPERVERLVLIGPTGYHDPLVTYASRLAVDWVREPPSLVLLATADYFRWGPRRLLRTARSMRSDSFIDKLPLVAVPALVVRGADDPMCTQAWAEHVVSLLPRGRLAVVPGAAHAAQWSNAAEVARLVEEAEHDPREA